MRKLILLFVGLLMWMSMMAGSSKNLFSSAVDDEPYRYSISEQVEEMKAAEVKFSEDDSAAAVIDTVSSDAKLSNKHLQYDMDKAVIWIGIAGMVLCGVALFEMKSDKD